MACSILMASGKVAIAGNGVGISSLSGGTSVDPSIILCYYGNEHDFGLVPDRYYQSCSYDTTKTSPFDLSSAGWEGTPCISASNNRPIWDNITTKVDELNEGEWTSDCFYRWVSDGNRCSTIYGPSFISEWYSTAALATVSYGTDLKWKVGNSTYTIQTDGTVNDGNWHHWALTAKYISRRTADYTTWIYTAFLDGVKVKTQAVEVYDIEQYIHFRTCVPDSWYVDGGCKSAFSQITLRKGIKWTENFTPPARPYFLGE